MDEDTSLVQNKKIQEITNLEENPLKKKNIWYLVFAIGILCAPQFAILTFTSVFFHDYAHFDLWTTIMTLIIIQLGAMVSRIWSGHWTDKKKNRKEYLKMCSILSACLFFILSFFIFFIDQTKEMTLFQTISLVCIFVASGIAVSAWHGVAYTELAVMTGLNKAATALGMANTVVFVTLFLVPISIPFIVSHWSWALVWLLAGICSLIAFLFFPKINKI